MQFETTAQDNGGAWVGYRPSQGASRPGSAINRLINAVEKLLRK